MSDAILVDLRRLYHHVIHGGVWDRKVDPMRLGKAIEEIERLNERIAKLEGALAGHYCHKIERGMPTCTICEALKEAK